MKKLLKYILPVGALLFASCSDFLEEKPKSFLSPDGFYQSVDDANAGLNAVYRTLRDRHSNNWAAPSWFEWATDIGEITDKNNHPHHNEPARLLSTFDASSGNPRDFWKSIYNHLKDANNLLKALPNIDFDETQKKQVEGQTRALRAYLYFDALRLYNDVPLLLESSTDLDYLGTLPRTPAAQVYEAIITDLEFAISVLPDRWTNDADHGRITRGGAAAMLAKVYLTMSGYPLKQTEKLEKARAILEDFVDHKKYGSHYELLPEYNMIFNESTGPANEGVWIVNFVRSTYGQGSQFHTEFAPLELYYEPGFGLTYGGGWSNTLPTDRFYNSYDKENDKRFKYTYWSSTAEVPEEFDALVPRDENGNLQHISFYRPHVQKFREKMPNNNSQGTGLDHCVIRYADVLLMYAEVLNELGNPKCHDYINMVRARAGLQPLSGMNKEAFREHMMLERAWELCYEGDRRFDLVRWDVFIQRAGEWNPQLTQNIKVNKHEFWPLPKSERDVNPNLTQNPGY